MIKYEYAIDKNGSLIHITEVNNENRREREYYCLACTDTLIPRIGNFKSHHFAHKKQQTCSSESYLHYAGKQLFYETYLTCLKESIPFYIELTQFSICNHFEEELGLCCKLSHKNNKYDLTQYFDKIFLETRHDTFIPDVLLKNKTDNEIIFIEIAVTHVSSSNKINSKKRIIELKVKNETDFEPILKKHFSQENNKIIFRNFTKKTALGSFCIGECESVFDLITFDKNGQFDLKQLSLTNIKRELDSRKNSILSQKILVDSGKTYPKTYCKELKLHIKQNKNVRNCLVCRYHGMNEKRNNLNPT